MGGVGEIISFFENLNKSRSVIGMRKNDNNKKDENISRENDFRDIAVTFTT